VAADGLVYCATGYWNPSLMAIRTDGKGEVTDSHVAFTLHRGVPHNPSPLVTGGQLYMVSDLGVLTAVDAKSGQELWRERLGGAFSASPTLADGRIYLVGEDATTYVLAPGPKFALMATNRLDGRALASPAFVDGAIYFRTDAHLYRIESAPSTATTTRRAAAARGAVKAGATTVPGQRETISR
jgi:outer membrane protein assembly factor BamB